MFGLFACCSVLFNERREVEFESVQLFDKRFFLCEKRTDKSVEQIVNQFTAVCLFAQVFDCISIFFVGLEQIEFRVVEMIDALNFCTRIVSHNDFACKFFKIKLRTFLSEFFCKERIDNFFNKIDSVVGGDFFACEIIVDCFIVDIVQYLFDKQVGNVVKDRTIVCKTLKETVF